MAVLFSPWHGAEWLYDRLTHRLEHYGWSVLTYEFNPEILKPDIAQVLASFANLQMLVAEDLNALIAHNNHATVHLIGTSLGNLPLILASEKLDYFSGVSMAAASSNLARSTWEGLRTQYIRAEFIKQGVDESDLDRAWDTLAPKNHVEVLRGKPLNLVVSKTDRVIPTSHQLQYLSAVRSAGANVNASYTRLGHYATIINFCLTTKLYN